MEGKQEWGDDRQTDNGDHDEMGMMEGKGQQGRSCNNDQREGPQQKLLDNTPNIYYEPGNSSNTMTAQDNMSDMSHMPTASEEPKELV